MNIIGCQPSQVAPSSWTQQDSEQYLKAMLLQLQPDIICLQECAQQQWNRLFADNTPYQIIGTPSSSHAGYVILAMNTNTMQVDDDIPNIPKLPISIAKVSWKQNDDDYFYVASCHLAPFAEGADERQYEMETLLNSIPNDNNKPIIIAGDTNMRDEEDFDNMKDAWKLNGQNVSTKYTWDTIDHHPNFNQYYGASTRQYQRRYDRVYISPNAKCTQFDLIANTPIGNSTTHFLSDHFGIVATLEDIV